jgi:hypothetical protein
MDSFDSCKKQIYSLIHQSLNASDEIFNHLNDLFKIYYERPVNNMIELKKRNAKNKGFLFEVFCVLYLQKKGYQCWLLQDIPENILKECNLTRQDLGIDAIAIIPGKKQGQILYFAIQCKYRKPTKNALKQTVHRVVWKDISTFLSLASRTGPPQGWTKHIIMTNAESVLWKGKKSPKDYTIAKKTFMKCDKIFWSQFIEQTPNSLITKSNKIEELNQESDDDIIIIDSDNDNDEKINEVQNKIKNNNETLRQKRLEWLNKLNL